MEQVSDSAEATVLVDLMTGGRLSVRGNNGAPRDGFMGVKMFAGLAIDYDIVITGPQDVSIGYCYTESCSHHLMLQAAESTDTDAVASENGASAVSHPGNVSSQASIATESAIIRHLIDPFLRDCFSERLLAITGCDPRREDPCVPAPGFRMLD